ncbi:unnamed protein product [Brachionus calyciflorus]|uniref:Transmembrane protein n=1 Tax=Brachionus calyciflorus TaxID=104777 RepID=A0A813NF14_9BILA|nr:unnamed protein product [Brachionus calyciflorus]
MEFYELNRLYDDYLSNSNSAKILDNYLHNFIPIIITIGIITSFLNIIIISRPYFQSTSKNNLFSQVKFNFLFQVLSLIIFISNNYEKYLIDNFYFKSNKYTYFRIKIYLNTFYNIFLYCVIWLFIIGCLDYCFIAIIKFHYNVNYSRQNRRLFQHQQILFQYQQKLLHHQQSRLRQNKSNFQVAQTFSASSSNESLENNKEPISPKIESSGQFFNSQDINYSDGFNDDCFIFEANFDQKRKRKKLKNEHDISFFSPKVIRYSTFTIILFSVFLALPQLFGFEVKENILTLSPSPMSIFSENDNIYYIQSDDFNSSKTQNLKYLKKKLDQSNMRRNLALGFVLRTQMDKNTNEIINRMKRTHKKFFTQEGFFNLASKDYNFCSLVKKEIEIPLITKSLSGRFKRQNEKRPTKIDLFNVTLICVAKSSLNELLAYNTLYFWLEHTMVISAPIFIALVLISSLMYTFLNYAKLIVQQAKIKRKRIKILKIQEQNSMAKFSNLMNVSFDSKSGKNATKLNSSDDYLNNSISTSNNKCDLKDRKLQVIQNEDQNLNKMFIIELAMYILFTFPYTLARLILDLFSKDGIKINLDFCCLYRIFFLLFHLNLLCKFFVLFALNARFRLSFARLFSFKPSTCFITDYNDEYYKKYDVVGIESNLCLLCLCPFSCFCWKHSNDELNDFKLNNDTMDFDEKDENDYDNEDYNEHSTDFNSNLHQFSRPADPDSEL